MAMSSGSWDPEDDSRTEDAGGVVEFLEEIEDLQNDDRYGFAADTLEGIHTTVENSGRVTIGQRQAIDNIRESVERQRR
jgi:hypothetical protein